MRVLVIGSSGYIGSRLIPVLLDRGHTVLAGARNPEGLSRFPFFPQVTPVPLDVLESASMDAALARGVDAVVYLVHGMGGEDFREKDLYSAEMTRDLVDRYEVGRIVYVSGIIPPIEESELSEHLSSRLEVERALSSSAAKVTTLRAAMVMGAGSTSFELMGQLAQRLPITVIPDWMRRRVEPIAVVDLVQAVAGAVETTADTRHFDVGGGESLPYPELIQRYMSAAGSLRAQITVPLLPEPLVAKLASWVTDVPSSTVEALMESLREHMVAAEGDWRGALVPADYRTLSVDEGLRRIFDATGSEESLDPMGLLPGDPSWANATESEEPQGGRVAEGRG